MITDFIPTTALPSTHFCKNCKRELPRDSFYISKSTECPDKFCKECRKAFSRRQYSSGKRVKPVTCDKLPYPVITRIEERELRMELIFNALEVVRKSIESKKMKMQQAEDLL